MFSHVVDPKRSKSSREAWEGKRSHWFEGEKKAIEKLENEGYQVLVWRSGYPDIMAEKNGRLFFFEVKRDDDTVKDEQKIALLALKKYNREVHVWRYEPKTGTFREGSIT
jgi:Holliday junction resolvase-like predicted endonuclease